MNDNINIANPKPDRVENETEKKIIKFLSTHGPTYYGDVIKSLKLSYKRGHEHLFNLKSKGLIKTAQRTSKIDVNR